RLSLRGDAEGPGAGRTRTSERGRGSRRVRGVRREAADRDPPARRACARREHRAGRRRGRLDLLTMAESSPREVLAALLDEASDPIFALDRSGTILRANKAACAVTGRLSEQLIGT